MRREFVGNVLVDHGGIALVDPLYVDTTDEDVEGFCEARVGSPLTCHEDEVVGAYVATGLGDNEYPIYADVVEVPGAGERVARITIDCLGVEPESDDLRGRLVGAVSALAEHVSTCV
ncbi:MAG TPA: hypothetical protein VFB39_07090 [Solirubrobacteraceae bacterium]|nr:hypothetical protein [Solirubrobacteraceae bacterium]